METIRCLCYIKVVNTHWDLTVALKEKALKKLRAFLLPFEYFMNGLHMTLNYYGISQNKLLFLHLIDHINKYI